MFICAEINLETEIDPETETDFLENTETAALDLSNEESSDVTDIHLNTDVDDDDLTSVRK